MKLNEKQLTKFKQKYEQKFNVKLSEKEAREQAQHLLDLVQKCLKANEL